MGSQFIYGIPSSTGGEILLFLIFFSMSIAWTYSQHPLILRQGHPWASQQDESEENMCLVCGLIFTTVLPH